jgi:hypothetical protein
MSIKSLLKDYQWHSPKLKKKHQIFDWGSLVVLVIMFVGLKYYGQESALLLIPIIGAQWYCFRIKAQDKELKKQVKH